MERKPFALPAKIESIQVLRFLGAMCITVYHFTGMWERCPFDFSHAVYLFYMISGFAAMLSTRAPEKRRQFLTRRLIRLLPLYWGLTVFTFIAGQFVPALVGYRPTAEHLIKSLLFIPYSRTTAKAGHAIRPIVGLGHTLQMEMLFYLLFWVALHLNQKYRGVIAAGFAAAVAAVGWLFPTKNPVIHFYTANPYVWTAFIAGLCIYGIFTLLERRGLQTSRPAVPALLAAAVAAALAVPVFLRKTSVWYDIFMFAAVLAAGLVWAVCGQKSPRGLVRLGNISYSYYLLHYYFVALAAYYLHVDTLSLRNVLLALLVSAVAWGVSFVSWYLVEQKCAAALQKLFLKQKTEKENVA